MLVEKESGLWQKYQLMLDSAVNRQRTDFEEERALLHHLLTHQREYSWWRAVKDGSYRDFYRAWYEERTA